MGVPAVIFAVEALILTLLLSGGMYLFLPIVLPIHFGARWMHARDDGAFMGMFRYAVEKDIYDPWARPSTTSKRPLGYGKSLQC